MYRYIKRVVDIVLSILLIIVLIPIWIFIPIIIKLDSKGSIFYKSNRLGRDGCLFKMYKFRTMKENSIDLRNFDGSTYNAEDDERLTKIGKLLRKFSIDELPQILNVLKGDMSIIGPRPDLPDAIALYNKEEQRKLNVRPGITGYSQAFYRNAINASSKFQNDVYYVDHYSFLLDFKIFIKTINTVMSKKNIYIKEEEIRDENLTNRS